MQIVCSYIYIVNCLKILIHLNIIGGINSNLMNEISQNN